MKGQFLCPLLEKAITKRQCFELRMERLNHLYSEKLEGIAQKHNIPLKDLYNVCIQCSNNPTRC